MTSDTQMEHVLTLLDDYWHLLDPIHPQLVISVTGGAKNFQLDGKKMEAFSRGLIEVSGACVGLKLLFLSNNSI